MKSSVSLLDVFLFSLLQCIITLVICLNLFVNKLDYSALVMNGVTSTNFKTGSKIKNPVYFFYMAEKPVMSKDAWIHEKRS